MTVLTDTASLKPESSVSSDLAQDAMAQVTMPEHAPRYETRTVDGVPVSITYATPASPVSDAEIRAYIERGCMQHINTTVDGLKLVVDGDDVEITYSLAPVPFNRIRRITGYLVGSMDRWNDAKTAEEHDRVKHAIPATAVRTA